MKSLLAWIGSFWGFAAGGVIKQPEPKVKPPYAPGYWQAVPDTELTVADLNYLAITSGFPWADGIIQISKAQPIAGGWVRYSIRKADPEDGGDLPRDVYVRKTAHSVRDTKPLFVDDWWWFNSGLPEAMAKA